MVTKGKSRAVPKLDFFASSTQAAQSSLVEAHSRIEELEQLVAELRQPSAVGGSAEQHNQLPLTKIGRDPQQMRRYFDPVKQAALVASIAELGIQEPLWVRPLAGGTYQLIAGERRYRAAESLGLREVPVRIIEVSSEQALKLALVENLQREDPNPFEQVEAILALLAIELNLDQDAVVGLFHQRAYLDRIQEMPSEQGFEEVNNVIHLQWQVVEQVFAAVVGRITPASFRVNYLPLLKLPLDVQVALRQGQIEYTKARAIARVKEEADRQDLLADAIADNLSLSEIRDRIKSLKPVPSPSLRSRFKEISSQMLKLPKDEWDDPKKAKKIAKLLEQLEGLVSPSEI